MILFEKIEGWPNGQSESKIVPEKKIMKLRIRENSVRLRLTKSEVTEFAEKGLVQNQTDFGKGQLFMYALQSSASAESVQATFADGRIEVVVPKGLADNWTATDEVGISSSETGLKIMIEKDFVCLTVREGEDESDAFPHPKENC